MEREVVASCPRCNERLVATRLTCDNCELELNGDFSLSKFDYLSNNELEFVECFLKYQGNFKAVQNEMGMAYPAAKKKLADILCKLELTTRKGDEGNELAMPIIKNIPIKDTDSLVVTKIKEKLNAGEGGAIVTLYNGDSCDIRFNKNGNGIISSKIPPANQLVWEVFDAAVEVVRNNGGRVKKGNAQSGAKLGSDKLMLNSVEGYIAHKVHGAQEGETAFGPGFVICAILDWAEICNNERGYLSIKPSFIAELNNGIRRGLDLNDLESKFNDDMLNIYKTAKKDLGYNASRFLQLVSNVGGLKAAKILIAKDDGTYGFEVLWKCDRLDLSVESHVLKPEYNDLFTDEERNICEERLEEYSKK